MDLEAYVGAIVGGRGAEVGAAPPLLGQRDHVRAARAVRALVPAGAAPTSDEFARALGLVVEIGALPGGAPFVLVGQVVLCASAVGTFAAVAFVALRETGLAFGAADVWLVAHRLAMNGAGWAPEAAPLPPG